MLFSFSAPDSASALGGGERVLPADAGSAAARAGGLNAAFFWDWAATRQRAMDRLLVIDRSVSWSHHARPGGSVIIMICTR